MASYGGPQTPIKSPLPPPETPPGPSDGNQRKDEKCRKTEVCRIYDESGKYWVDVEVMKNASFLGNQWKMPDGGNYSQQTITQLVRNLTNDGTCGDVMAVGMDPDKPITGEGGSGGGGSGGSGGAPAEAKAPARKSSKFESRNNVRRKFSNNRKDLTCCKDMKRRVKFNDIEAEFLKAAEEGKSARAGGGSGEGPKMPPKEPGDYKKAIKASDDGSDFYVDICIPKSANFDRGKALRRQGSKPTGMWKSGDVTLPGSSNETDPKGAHFRLDPYQVPINFGPDSLAVEFFDGEDGGGGGGPPPAGGGGATPPAGGSGAP